MNWLRRIYARLGGIDPHSMRMEWDPAQDAGDFGPIIDDEFNAQEDARIEQYIEKQYPELKPFIKRGRIDAD